MATLTATKDSEETILALVLWEVNHRIFGPSWKNYRQWSLYSTGDDSSAMGMEPVGVFFFVICTVCDNTFTPYKVHATSGSAQHRSKQEAGEC